MDRKEFIRYSAEGIGMVGLLPILSFCKSNARQNENVEKNRLSQNFSADVDIEVSAVPSEVQLLPGPKTEVYTYQSELLKGDQANLSKMNDSFLGPVIKLKKGQKVRLRFINQLSRESIIHWHGLHIPPEMDGHPMYAVKKGEQYIYEFEVNNCPGTYWFHPHPDKITGPQVYYGLAGLFIVEDDNKELPMGEYDVPIVIQDRMFDDDNQLVYLQNNRMNQMQGFLGDRILVNGNIEKNFEVNRSGYRLRVLNGSNSRIYKLAWSDNEDITIIGTDGGFLSKPLNKSYLMLAPGERAEIWKDFSSFSAGSHVTLRSLSFNDGSSFGMGGRMMGQDMMGQGRMHSGTHIKNGEAFDICTFTIGNNIGSGSGLPANFPAIDPLKISDAVNGNSPRKFHFFNEHMQWVINGETFEMHDVAAWEKVKLNTTEIWEFINDNKAGGMMQNMMQMPHPVHIHGLQFQIIERDTSDMDPSVYESVKEGFIDEGWQDTFLLMPGMRVKIILRFKDYTGKYIYHCHNLEHEDMGMMRNYEIED